MNEQMKRALDQCDKVLERVNFLARLLDQVVKLLKTPVISSIPSFVNIICSKFSLATIGFFSLLYIAFCLRNAVISIFFEHGPVLFSLSLAIAALIVTLLGVYIVSKMTDCWDKIVASSPCRISSFNFFEVLSFASVLAAILSLFYGIYLTIETKDFLMLVYGIAGTVFFLLLAIYNASPEEFAIVQDEKASAGEDFAAICTFGIKLALRLIPIAIFALPIVGICKLIPELFDTYTESIGNARYLEIDVMEESMKALWMYVMIGIIPLFVYIYYLVSYVSLDILRAILSLPQKLDDLKK